MAGDKRKGSVPYTETYGKVPPNNIDIEKVILGACLIEKTAFERVYSIIKSSDFYSSQNIEIFSCYELMYKQGIPIDLETVVVFLQQQEKLDYVGGAFYVAGLTNSVVSTANLEQHCQILLESSIKRQIIQISGYILTQSYDHTVSAKEILSNLVSLSGNLATGSIKGESFKDVVFRTVKNILDRRSIDDIGVMSYIPSLDRIIDCFVNGLFYVIAARPAMGKTAFMIQLIKNVCKQIDGNVGVMELETYDEVFVQRMIANEISLDSRILKRPITSDETKEKIQGAGDKLMSYNLISDFTPTLTDTEIRVKAKIWKSKYNIKILFIDYLQYVSSDNTNLPRERQVSQISKTLAILAKEINIPIIAFAQLSREVYKRADKRPQLSDLRESGSIEQDARCVMFLHRPDYYGETIDAETGRSLEGVTEVIVAKNNDGDTGKSYLSFDKRTNTFIDLEELNAEDNRYSVSKDVSSTVGWRPVDGADFSSPIPEFE